MNIYADESFYQETYLQGRTAVITAAFLHYAMQASALIDYHTFGNIDADNLPDEVKYCCCELAEQLCTDESQTAQSEGIASEKVEGWSVSYESTESRKTALQAAQRDCIRKWLAHTGLLYSGVG